MTCTEVAMISRHLAGIHERRLKRRTLGRSLLVAALGHAIGGGQGPEGAGILIDEREQMPARALKLDKLRLHALLHIGVLLLPHREVAHHGSQRRGERPRIGRGPASSRRRRLRSQRLNELGIDHLAVHTTLANY